MKNTVTAIIAALLIASCSHKPVKINLVKTVQISPTLNENYYKKTGGLINGLFSNIEVVDVRKNQESFGVKEFGEEEVQIINDQDLADLIKNEIIQNLKARNQYIDQDKTLKVTLKTLKYNSKRGFFLGKSKVKIELKATLMDSDYAEYGRAYQLENERSHFLVSLEGTDQETVNSALRDVIDEITEEGDLQDALIDQNGEVY